MAARMGNHTVKTPLIRGTLKRASAKAIPSKQAEILDPGRACVETLRGAPKAKAKAKRKSKPVGNFRALVIRRSLVRAQVGEPRTSG